MKTRIKLLIVVMIVCVTAWAANEFGTTYIGGGYGDTGITLADNGNISANGGMLVDGTATFDSIVNMSGGLGDTNGGAVVDTYGDFLSDGFGSFSGSISAVGNATLAGGVTEGGVTINATTNATQVGGTASIAGVVDIGGGYSYPGGSGATISDAGAASFNSTLIADNTATLRSDLSVGGVASITGSMDVGGDITGNSIEVVEPVAVTYGGTGSTSAADARAALDVEIGVDVQGYDADLADLADGTLSKSKIENSANWDTAYSDRMKWDGGATGLIAATARASLELGGIAIQAPSAVAITGGTITGITELNGAGGALHVGSASAEINVLLFMDPASGDAAPAGVLGSTGADNEEGAGGAGGLLQVNAGNGGSSSHALSNGGAGASLYLVGGSGGDAGAGGSSGADGDVHIGYDAVGEAARGKLFVHNLPTADPHVAGQIYVLAGVLMISAG